MANLDIYDKITSSNLNAFKERIITECNTRRKYTGTLPKITNIALSTENTAITSNWFNTFIEPLKIIDSSKINYSTTKDISVIKALTAVQAQVATLEGKDVHSENDDGCSAACTGLCHTECSGNCRGSCETECVSCGGACSSGCGNACASGCGGACSSDGCTGSCGVKCNKSCTGTCSNTCGVACGGNCHGCTGCTGTCSGTCQRTCSDTSG